MCRRPGRARCASREGPGIEPGRIRCFGRESISKTSFPSKLGYEAAGVVESVGPDVKGLQPGDAVSTIPAFLQGKYGVYGDVALVPAAAVENIPRRSTGRRRPRFGCST